MGAASQGEGTGLGSGGHEAKGVTMGMRRIPHRGRMPGPVNDPGLPASVSKPPAPPAPPPPSGGA